MRTVIDIALFVAFVVGGFWLAGEVEIASPFILLIAALLSVHYWRTRRRLLASLAGVFVSLLLLGQLTLAGLVLAGHQWDKIEREHAGTKTEVEAHIFLARTVQRESFTNLYMSIFFAWNAHERSYQDSNRRVYAPADGDKYYAYEVIGFLPIDVIYDRNDKVKLAFNSFDF